MPTHYDALGLTPDASSEQIQKAYSARVKAIHPDLNGDDATGQFQQSFGALELARTVLLNSQTRKAYDLTLKRAATPTHPVFTQAAGPVREDKQTAFGFQPTNEAYQGWASLSAYVIESGEVVDVQWSISGLNQVYIPAIGDYHPTGETLVLKPRPARILPRTDIISLWSDHRGTSELAVLSLRVYPRGRWGRWLRRSDALDQRSKGALYWGLRIVCLLALLKACSLLSAIPDETVVGWLNKVLGRL